MTFQKVDFTLACYTVCNLRGESGFPKKMGQFGRKGLHNFQVIPIAAYILS